MHRGMSRHGVGMIRESWAGTADAATGAGLFTEFESIRSPIIFVVFVEEKADILWRNVTIAGGTNVGKV
jgi:hypothetical protein